MKLDIFVLGTYVTLFNNTCILRATTYHPGMITGDGVVVAGIIFTKICYKELRL